jgi:hypothetical protein
MTDPFSAVMGDRRGWEDPRAAPAQHVDGASATSTPKREPGVSKSGLPFQAAGRDESVAAIKACAAALGCKPNSNQYEHWYYAEVTRYTHGQASRRPPSARTVIRRLGTWRRALQAAGF